MSKKVLDININPKIRVYTYHAFFHAIVSGKEKVSSTAAIIDVRDYGKYDWYSQKGKLDCIQDSNSLVFTANQWNLDMNYCIWRKSKIDDEIEIRIQKQLYSNYEGAISIGIIKETGVCMLDENEYAYIFGNSCGSGLFNKKKNEERNQLNMQYEAKMSLVLKKHNNVLSSYVKKNEKLIKLNEIVINEQDIEDANICINVNLGNNSYYEWFYSNFIQMYGTVTYGELPLDYLFNPVKRWYTYETNYFLQYRTINRGLIEKSGLSVLDYVKTCIDMNQYVEMWLNENFLDGLPEEMEPHIHQNLIYGYDDELEELNVLQLVEGRPVEKKLKYRQFTSEHNFNQVHKLIVPTSYEPDYNIYRLSPSYLMYILKKYLDADDMSMNMQHCLMPSENAWGIGVLYKLREHAGLQMILMDHRMSYLLYERAVCMFERISYLQARELITYQDKENILQYVKEAENITRIILNLVLLYQQREAEGNFRGDKATYVDRVDKQLNNLIIIEKKYIPILIEALKKNSNQ